MYSIWFAYFWHYIVFTWNILDLVVVFEEIHKNFEFDIFSLWCWLTEYVNEFYDSWIIKIVQIQQNFDEAFQLLINKDYIPCFIIHEFNLRAILFSFRIASLSWGLIECYLHATTNDYNNDLCLCWRCTQKRQRLLKNWCRKSKII